MSDTPQDEGWWKAPDGLWYPPETHPDHQPTPTPSRRLPTRSPSPWPSQAETAESGSSPSPTSTPSSGPQPSGTPSAGPGAPTGWGRLALWVTVALVIVGAAVVALVVVVASGDGDGAVEAADVTVTRAEAAVPLDALVTTALDDGDGLKVFGTSRNSVATAAEIWGPDVLVEGPGPGVQVGSVTVASGVPYLYGIAATDDGYLAVGEIYFPDSGLSSSAVFASDDGLDWFLAAEPGAVGGATAAYDVAVVGEVTLAVAADDAFGINRLYRSDDGGSTWRVADPVGLDRVRIWGLAAHDGRFWAVGSADTVSGPRPVVFGSDDGALWSEAAQVSTGGALTGQLLDVTATEAGLMAVGTRQGPVSSDLLVLFSADGAWWEPVIDGVRTTPDEELLVSVAARGAGAVAVGLVEDRYTFWEITVDR